tara:strand:+ start:1085 stop:1219 length:135 start_codon:yes stop_codon:yes gene_type:complete
MGWNLNRNALEAGQNVKLFLIKKKVILEHSFRIFVEDNGEGKDG